MCLLQFYFLNFCKNDIQFHRDTYYLWYLFIGLIWDASLKQSVCCPSPVCTSCPVLVWERAVEACSRPVWPLQWGGIDDPCRRCLAECLQALGGDPYLPVISLLSRCWRPLKHPLRSPIFNSLSARRDCIQWQGAEHVTKAHWMAMAFNYWFMADLQLWWKQEVKRLGTTGNSNLIRFPWFLCFFFRSLTGNI